MDEWSSDIAGHRPFSVPSTVKRAGTRTMASEKREESQPRRIGRTTAPIRRLESRPRRIGTEVSPSSPPREASPQRPLSPRDTTPLVVNGKTLHRGTIIPIRSPSEQLRLIQPATITRNISPVSTPRLANPLPEARTEPSPASSPCQGISPSPSVPMEDSPPKKITSGIPNYSSMTREEQSRHREDFRIKFGILRSAWPRYHIPVLPDTMSLEAIHAGYEEYVNHIWVHNSSERYRLILVLCWLVIEVVLTKLGLKASGYTLSQYKLMSRYDQLLIQLGEQSGGGMSSEWSPLANIIYLSGFNAVMFIIFNMLTNYLGNEGIAQGIMDALNNCMSYGMQQTDQNNIDASVPGGGPMPQISNTGITGLLANFGPNAVNAIVKPQPVVSTEEPPRPRRRPPYME